VFSGNNCSGVDDAGGGDGRKNRSSSPMVRSIYVRVSV
jgi:hypothetical protein